MKIIDGEWRPCTIEERAALGVILFRCVKHPARIGCECRLPGCVRQMVQVEAPRAGTFVVRDTRRIDPVY